MAWVDRVQLRRATCSATPAAWTGHDRQHSGRDRSDRSAAGRDAIRAVAVPRIPGLPKRGPIRPPRFHWQVLQDAVASRMQGRSNKGLPRAHEVLRDSALAWSGSPAATSSGSLTRCLACWSAGLAWRLSQAPCGPSRTRPRWQLARNGARPPTMPRRNPAPTARPGPKRNNAWRMPRQRMSNAWPRVAECAWCRCREVGAES